MHAAISFKEVSKRYGQKAAVDNVTFSVKQGEIFGFCGPNGAGKTTSIRILLNGIHPTSGQVEIFGHSARSNDTHKDIGFLSGDMALEDDLTGHQYLQFVSSMYGKDCSEKIKKLSTLIKADLGMKIRNYSRGNKQKIGLIAALMHDPKLLILDEPTSGFDPLVQEKFVELIRAYKANGGTVFMSSHILTEVQRLCDRVAFIREGSLVSIKTVAELEESSIKKIFVKAKPNEIKHIQNNFHRVPGLTLEKSNNTSAEFSYSGEPKFLMQFFSVYALKDIVIKEQDLEEIFVEYYNEKKEAKDV